MSCEDCANVLHPSGNSINERNGIPIRSGEALSSLNERATVIGSIPQVLRYPGFTLVNGGVIEAKVSNGGIANMASFFKSRTGAYNNKNAQMAANCCE